MRYLSTTLISFPFVGLICMKRTRLLRRVARGVSRIYFYTLWLFWLDAYFREKHIGKEREIHCYAAASHRTAYFMRAGHTRLISHKDAIEEYVF